MKKFMILLLCLFIISCNTNPIIQSVPIEVKVPIGVPCKIAMPDKPASLLETLKKEDDLFTKIKVILAEIENKNAYEKQLEASMRGCQ